MSSIVAVVEGHGEVEAVPMLIRRYIGIVNPPIAIDIPRPIRVGRSKLVKAGELERAVEFASYQGGAVLVLLDADDDCPATIGPQLLARARAIDPSAAVVLAKSEFEAWFLAAAESIRGHRGLRTDLTSPVNVEDVRDAKGWLSEQMVGAWSVYSPTVDQVALTAIFDFAAARAASPSFDKMLRELDRIFEALQHLPANSV